MRNRSIGVLGQKQIPFRLVYHAAKTGDKWLIDFASRNFIPENEDISKLNKALE
jgi:hypothetical protein